MNIKWNPDYEAHEKVHENGYIEVMQMNTEKCEWVRGSVERNEDGTDLRLYTVKCNKKHHSFEQHDSNIEACFYKYCPYCGKIIEVKDEHMA